MGWKSKKIKNSLLNLFKIKNMRQYYYSNGNEKFGPFTLEELRGKPITPKTLIWTDGMTEWQEAANVLDVREILPKTPPPLPLVPKSEIIRQPEQIPFVQPPKPAHKKSSSPAFYTILVIAVIAAAIFFVSKSNNNTPPSSYGTDSSVIIPEQREKTPQELRQELKAKEENQYLKYLSVEYELFPTLSGRARIKGTIHNSASLAKYKDVVLRMTFFTKTNTELGIEDKVLYEYVSPSGSRSFDWKIAVPNKTQKISMAVVDASIAND